MSIQQDSGKCRAGSRHPADENHGLHPIIAVGPLLSSIHNHVLQERLARFCVRFCICFERYVVQKALKQREGEAEENREKDRVSM